MVLLRPRSPRLLSRHGILTFRRFQKILSAQRRGGEIRYSGPLPVRAASSPYPSDPEERHPSAERNQPCFPEFLDREKQQRSSHADIEAPGRVEWLRCYLSPTDRRHVLTGVPPHRRGL